MPRRTRTGLAAALVVALTLTAIVLAGLQTRRGAAAVRDSDLAAAIAASTDLGLSPATERVALNLGLTGRDSSGLAAMLGAGGQVSPDAWAARFGPDPAAVAQLKSSLRTAGLSASWQNGSPVLAADGTAASVGRLLGVTFHDYAAPDGRHFYAAAGDTHRPAWMSAVTSIAGLDDFSRVTPHALHPGSPVGITPHDLDVFYNFGALHQAGLDGKGVTVLFPDSAPGTADLDTFAKKFNLPPFDLEVKGRTTPDSTDSISYQEVVQDLDIVHAVAPAAKLIVYNTIDDSSISTDQDIVQYFVRLNDQMVSDHLGSVISESMGWCAGSFDSASAQQLDAVMQRAAAEGMTVLVSSGDEGGFGCVRADSDQHRVEVAMPASDPYVTATGGTTVFLGQDSTYYKEMAWGNAVSWSGSGGGNSSIFPRPSWQTGPGVIGSASNGKRQEPDVASAADENTGYEIAIDNKFCACGNGTSAAAPLWSGFIALLDQDLAAKGLHPAGFANPAIYSIGARNTSLPGPPFHDVTQGDNLVYVTTPGWDYATGWGSPNAGALASAWEDYISGGGS